MKKIIIVFLALICTAGVISCSHSQAEPYVVSTIEATPEEKVQEYINDSKEVIAITHYEMSDGTWKTGEHTYKYKLKITGRSHNAVCDTTYIILSNIEDITFEQAWKASGLSGNSKDYFNVEDAVFVGIG